MPTPEELRRSAELVNTELRSARPAGGLADFRLETVSRATYRPGDRVRDKVTGLGGTVELTRYVQTIFPAADRGGG